MERDNYISSDMSERYNRHAAFLSTETEKTQELQNKLHDARISVLGCGAGSTLAPHIARMGIGTRGIVYLADPDTVDVSNLNRQEYNEAHIGVNKAQALNEQIKSINSSVKTQVFSEGVQPNTVEYLVSNSDVIVDMIDVGVPEVMFAVHDEAKKLQKPVITGLDVGDGIISYVFDYRDPNAMGVREFVGLSESATIEEIKEIPSFALAAQFIIGATEKVFNNHNEAIEYYTGFFETKGSELMEKLPPEAREVMPKIVSGELDHIPQTHTAAALLGATHAELIKEIVLGNPVRVAPDSVRVNLLELVRPNHV